MSYRLCKRFFASVTSGNMIFTHQRVGQAQLAYLVTVLLLATVFNFVSFMCAELKIFCRCFGKLFALFRIVLAFQRLCILIKYQSQVLLFFYYNFTFSYENFPTQMIKDTQPCSHLVVEVCIECVICTALHRLQYGIPLPPGTMPRSLQEQASRWYHQFACLVLTIEVHVYTYTSCD